MYYNNDIKKIVLLLFNIKIVKYSKQKILDFFKLNIGINLC